jgi:hypothetical protein
LALRLKAAERLAQANDSIRRGEQSNLVLSDLQGVCLVLHDTTDFELVASLGSSRAAANLHRLDRRQAVKEAP